MKNASKESALKSLAKRPKLFKAIQKGTEFHKLKEVGEVSGGFIRTLMWAGVAVKNDGIVTLAKGIKESSLPSLESGVEKATRTPKRDRESSEKVGKKGKGKNPGRRGVQSDRLPLKSEEVETLKGRGKKGAKKGKGAKEVAKAKK